jgi:hypothetical protein
MGPGINSDFNAASSANNEEARLKKIRAVMTLMGVLPCDMDHACKNFEKLADDEIEQKFVRLLEGERRLAEWRLKRSGSKEFG